MSALSVRAVARDCLGARGTLSVNDDLFGYVFRDEDGSIFGTLAPGDTLPGSGEPTTRSLRRHLETISGAATDLVMILVGHEEDFSGVVTRDEVTKAQYAIQVARDLYAQVDLGIRRIRWSRIPWAEAGGYTYISDGSEAQDLTDDWSGANGGIDVFLVQVIGDAAGWSNTGGPCDKTAKFYLSGAVIEFTQSRRFTGIVLGHEVGHYLGLEHDGSITNLMGVDSNDDGIGETTANSTGITAAQGRTMRSHCSVRGPC